MVKKTKSKKPKKRTVRAATHKEAVEKFAKILEKEYGAGNVFINTYVPTRHDE